LIRKLEAAGATDIVLDIDLSSRQSDAADQAFLEALEQTRGSVILPSFVQQVHDAAGKSITDATRPLPEFRRNSWPATANVVTEDDGRIRKYSRGMMLDGEFVPSIGALLAGIYDPDGDDFFIDFAIKAGTIPVLSYADVLDGTAQTEKIRGKKIIVGATAIELGDRFSIPNGLVIPGATLQALATESLIQGRALARTSAVATGRATSARFARLASDRESRACPASFEPCPCH
jgi:CHASE2 domain-containing sensor protein